MEHLANSMQDHIRILKKDLSEASEQIAAHKANVPTAAAMDAIPASTTTTAAATQAPPATPARHIYQEYGEEPNFYRPPRRQMDHRPHVASSAAKMDTSCPTVLPAQSFNASSASKHAPAPAPHLEDKYWSCRPTGTTPTPILTCI